MVKNSAAAALAVLVLTGCLAPAALSDGESTPPGPPAASELIAAASPSPSPSPSSAPEPSASVAEPGTALAALETLSIKGRAPKTGYDRDEFGAGWVDVDRNGCDTRNDMLRLRLVDLEMSGTCKVMAGDLLDPFTGEWIHFERGGTSEVDIDHLVALSDAWQKGAQQWEFAQRVAFANDPLNLEPVDAGENRAKGDGDAATWLPPDSAFRCEYVARQIAVKVKYGVWVTPAEHDAMATVLGTCPDEPLPDFGDQPIIADNTGGPPPGQNSPAAVAPAPAPVAVPAPADAATGELDPRYPFCKDLPAGLGPYVKGVDPEYEWYRDGDKDGTVCE